jgi:spore germination protein GerM
MFFIFVVMLLMIVAVVLFKPHHRHLLFNEPAEQNTLTVYFCKSHGSNIMTVAVERTPPADKMDKAFLTHAISALLEGPTSDEKQQGYFSEIPTSTRLIAIDALPDRLVVNLSSQYSSGGGSNSMVQRYRQLAKTILAVPHQKPVYVEVAGKSLEVLGGEGLVIHEPIVQDDTLN